MNGALVWNGFILHSHPMLWDEIAVLDDYGLRRDLYVSENILAQLRAAPNGDVTEIMNKLKTVRFPVSDARRLPEAFSLDAFPDEHFMEVE